MKSNSFEEQKGKDGQGEEKNNAHKSIELSGLEVTPQGRIQNVDNFFLHYVHEDEKAIRESKEWKEAVQDLLDRKLDDVNIEMDEGVRAAIMDPEGYKREFANYWNGKKAEKVLDITEGERSRYEAVYASLLTAQEGIERELSNEAKTNDIDADKIIEAEFIKALRLVQMAKKNTLEIEEFLDNKKNEILFSGKFGTGELEHEGN